ncbi:hypothetical protein [Maribacter sp. 2307ULW6-5]|uniref:hypothetical protein n=1 Tax=Maribacter sp. 2307ULW6-5 TaxID=3386275 RepID=UPI0039BC6BE9
MKARTMALAFQAMVLLSCTGEVCKERLHKPNTVFLVVDDLGRLGLGFMGSEH